MLSPVFSPRPLPSPVSGSSCTASLPSPTSSAACYPPVSPTLASPAPTSNIPYSTPPAGRPAENICKATSARRAGTSQMPTRLRIAAFAPWQTRTRIWRRSALTTRNAGETLGSCGRLSLLMFVGPFSFIGSRECRRRRKVRSRWCLAGAFLPLELQ